MFLGADVAEAVAADRKGTVLRAGIDLGVTDTVDDHLFADSVATDLVCAVDGAALLVLTLLAEAVAAWRLAIVGARLRRLTAAPPGAESVATAQTDPLAVIAVAGRADVRQAVVGVRSRPVGEQRPRLSPGDHAITADGAVGSTRIDGLSARRIARSVAAVARCAAAVVGDDVGHASRDAVAGESQVSVRWSGLPLELRAAVSRGPHASPCLAAVAGRTRIPVVATVFAGEAPVGTCPIGCTGILCARLIVVAPRLRAVAPSLFVAAARVEAGLTEAALKAGARPMPAGAVGKTVVARALFAIVTVDVELTALGRQRAGDATSALASVADGARVAVVASDDGARREGVGSEIADRIVRSPPHTAVHGAGVAIMAACFVGQAVAIVVDAIARIGRAVPWTGPCVTLAGRTPAIAAVAAVQRAARDIFVTRTGAVAAAGAVMQQVGGIAAPGQALVILADAVTARHWPAVRG